MARAPKQLLICDLDNTLYDWVDYFVAAFYAMVDKVVEITGCDREELLNDFRSVHRKHRDSEHPFALFETATIQRVFPGSSAREIAQTLDPALHAFNSVRKSRLILYPFVKETLAILSTSDVSLVAHTESKLFGAIDRLTRLELLPYFTHIYCRERTNSLHPFLKTSWDRMEAFQCTRWWELSHHQRKPNPDVILEICAREHVNVQDCAYIGDSLSKDVLMAKRAGVFSIWAKYGTSHDPLAYEKLVRISHWTNEDVIREKELQLEAKNVVPDFVAKDSFREVLAVLEQMRVSHF